MDDMKFEKIKKQMNNRTNTIVIRKLKLINNNE